MAEKIGGSLLYIAGVIIISIACARQNVCMAIRYWRGDRGEKLFDTKTSFDGMTWNVVEGKRRWVNA